MTQRTIGVEEEFHVLDTRTRRLAPRAQAVLSRTQSADGFVEELQQCIVESNSAVCSNLESLADDLRARRAQLIAAAQPLGLGLAAAGAMPLAAPAELDVTATDRYRRMLADYQLLAREQLICGTQVHVGVADRDEAVAIAAGLNAYVPTLLALSASSPFWSDGSDTGYASTRTLIWQRWPTAGPFPDVHSVPDYDAEVAALIASKVISDPGMLYFDVRPSAHVPTVELRVCDSCPSVDTIVLITGLFRALVTREGARVAAAIAADPVSPYLYRAAIWQAARSGLDGDLVDIPAGGPRPATAVAADLAAGLRPELEATGDWDLVQDLLTAALRAGSSAATQRRVLRRRGRQHDVVDHLIAQTAGILASPAAATFNGAATDLLVGYHPEVGDTSTDVDEAIDAYASPRPHYEQAVTALANLGPAELRHRQYQIEHQQTITHMTFRPSGSARAQVFPVDPVPRIITADEWDHLNRGLTQRALALNAFVCDIYTDQRIIADGVMPQAAIDRTPGYRTAGTAGSWQRVRTHIIGTDIICTEPGSFLVLEDNLRSPSGAAYAAANRTLMADYLPEIRPPAPMLHAAEIYPMIARTLHAARPPHADPDAITVLLSTGPDDSAWFEHTTLAAHLEIPLLESSDLTTSDGRVHALLDGELHPVAVIYTRMDEDMLLSSPDAAGTALRTGLLTAVCRATVAVINALGNGVGDDKAIYTFVPDMIKYYLQQRPLLGQVPTWLCARRADRDHVLSHLAELVTKPIDGHGGSGVLVGPDATASDLEDRRAELLDQPDKFIGQAVIDLTTHPTFDGQGLYPRHIDLRTFTHVRADPTGELSAHLAPAALTRVAPQSSLIVNSSKGGGAKDTWILRAP